TTRYTITQHAQRYIDLKEITPSHRIKTNADPEFRRSAISISDFSENRFVVGIYGRIYEIYKENWQVTFEQIHDSLLVNNHFVQHSRAFVVFNHSTGWPNPEENRYSYQFLTTNRISVATVMYGNTSHLTTKNAEGIGNYSWSRSDMLAECVPYYRKDGTLYKLTDFNNWRQQVIVYGDAPVFRYSFPDALIILNEEIRYPFSLQLDDYHFEIAMDQFKFVRVLVPCGARIKGFQNKPYQSQTQQPWITEELTLTEDGICKSSQGVDYVILSMAIMDTVFVRVYASELEMVTFSSIVLSDIQYPLYFYLQDTSHTPIVYDIDAQVTNAEDFANRMRDTMDNIHEYFIGNNEHQQLASFSLPSQSFTRLESPITRTAETITIQTHRPNGNLRVVKYAAIDEIQVYPLLTSPVGWRLINPENTERYVRTHLLVLPDESESAALGLGDRQFINMPDACQIGSHESTKDCNVSL
ncbi:MAG: hypothetical protein EBR93_04030, partial [Bacteroidetes bacterium]|nr:hypothetical protein [Bacteroidota bacterium]